LDYCLKSSAVFKAAISQTRERLRWIFMIHDSREWRTRLFSTGCPEKRCLKDIKTRTRQSSNTVTLWKQQPSIITVSNWPTNCLDGQHNIHNIYSLFATDWVVLQSSDPNTECTKLQNRIRTDDDRWVTTDRNEDVNLRERELYDDNSSSPSRPRHRAVCNDICEQLRYDCAVRIRCSKPGKLSLTH